MLRDLTKLRRAGESALRTLAETFDEPLGLTDDSDQRQVASIVFVDIEGFSDLVARRGDDVAGDLLDALDEALADATSGTRAWVVKRLGDGAMIAAEDAEDGVRVASRLPGCFAARVRGLSDSPRVRVGGHRGEVRRRGDDLFGYHVNLAARVAEEARGGQTLITRALLEAAGDIDPAVPSDRGVLIAKGVPERPALYELTVPEVIGP